jgi:hypothetical protein
MDVCVMTYNQSLLLLLQRDNNGDPEPKVIAKAVAAFQENNKIRIKHGKESLEKMVIPCITLVGTFPVFYLVPVTEELNRGVEGGQYPGIETVVLKHAPRVPGRISDGMKPVENRRKILQCLEAFKRFVYEL